MSKITQTLNGYGDLVFVFLPLLKSVIPLSSGKGKLYHAVVIYTHLTCLLSLRQMSLHKLNITHHAKKLLIECNKEKGKM